MKGPWRKTEPTAQSKVGNHDVAIWERRNKKPKNVRVNGVKYVAKPGFRDLSRPRQAIAGGLELSALGAASGAGYLSYQGGQVIKGGIDTAASIVNFFDDIGSKFITGHDRKAIEKLEVLIKSNNFNEKELPTVKKFMSNAVEYRLISGIYDETAAGIDQGMSRSTGPASRIMPDQIEKEGPGYSRTKIHDWVNKKLGKYINPDKHGEYNQTLIKQRKDTHDILQSSYNDIAEHLNKPTPSPNTLKKNMKKFNDAYAILKQIDERVEKGVENATTAEVQSYKDAIHQLGPNQWSNTSYIPGGSALLGGAIVYALIHSKVVKPLKRLIYRI
ncbi:hypothetical protein GOV14_04920 [Candidatus Pacearchaeota archaeon]|nr:hypothetical protein [Candidatus Pacearchaeota archaeon]